MEKARIDSDRIVLGLVFLTSFTGLVIFAITYLTVLSYRILNDTGHAVEIAALGLCAFAMLLSIYLGLAARSRALSSAGLSGAGWFLAAVGLVLLFPALGGLVALADVPNAQSFGGVAGAIFLLIGSAGLLQAERQVRDRGPAAG